MASLISISFVYISFIYLLYLVIHLFLFPSYQLHNSIHSLNGHYLDCNLFCIVVGVLANLPNGHPLLFLVLPANQDPLTYRSYCRMTGPLHIVRW